ncbi:AI-2E family transporter [Pacificimonas flava]|uniref:Putative permease often clustered with de novo purine synthesis n=1 Tax=Pacificimonas flava TaxID=1234595 RepID=M2U8R7_9SPHN|nr:AI-2E family transporter [Pacificimonas flava]EMD84373.1 Putative permease often clustered with de novo purine synthesis [Pacificimonas flava]MBB5279752.1 putative PurR-regulated permease PerM [Pacificimonas flava]
MTKSVASSGGPVLPKLHWGWLLVIAICIWFFWSTSGILPPFLAGIVIAYLLDPVADRMEARGIPRWLATAIALIVFFALIAGAIVLMAPLVTAQATALVTALPGLIESLTPVVQHWYDELTLVISLDDLGRNLMERAASVSATVARSIISQSLALFNILALLIIVPVVSFYSLRDFDQMTARMRSFVPPRYKSTAEGLWREADEALGGFIRGQSLVCASLAVFYATGWWLTGLDYALVLGLIAGILAFVPYLGAVISVALALLVGLGQFGFDPLHLILIFAVFQVGQILEGSVLTPNLIGNRIGLHPLWVLFAVFAGGEIAGLWGVFLAVPVAAVVAVFVRAVMRQYLRSALYGPAAPPR